MKAKSNEDKQIDLPVAKLNPETCISNHKFLAPPGNTFYGIISLSASNHLV